jgi:hypothetical protein
VHFALGVILSTTNFTTICSCVGPNPPVSPTFLVRLPRSDRSPPGCAGAEGTRAGDVWVVVSGGDG